MYSYPAYSYTAHSVLKSEMGGAHAKPQIALHIKYLRKTAKICAFRVCAHDIL